MTSCIRITIMKVSLIVSDNIRLASRTTAFYLVGYINMHIGNLVVFCSPLNWRVWVFSICSRAKIYSFWLCVASFAPRFFDFKIEKPYFSYLFTEEFELNFKNLDINLKKGIQKIVEFPAIRKNIIWKFQVFVEDLKSDEQADLS